MKALTYRGIRSVRYEDAPDPVLRQPNDALVQVELAAICGSDLHVYRGREVGLDPGTVLGHEFVGRVVEMGPEVRRFQVGDRVACPFTTSCGGCFFCQLALSARCVAGELFGWVEKGRGLQGVQAERVRVPLADATLIPIEDLPAEQAILLGDVLPTGWHCARMAGIEPDGTYAVVGCGPVGLMAIAAARDLGAGRLFAIDRVPERLDLAERFGAIPIDAGNADPVAAIRDATSGFGADGVLEAVGSAEAGRLAFDLTRPGGTIAIVGVHHEASFPFSPGEAYDRNLTLRIGRCPARSLTTDVLPLVRRRGAELSAIFTHRLPLSRGAEGYEIFDGRREGCIKMGLVP